MEYNTYKFYSQVWNNVTQMLKDRGISELQPNLSEPRDIFQHINENPIALTATHVNHDISLVCFFLSQRFGAHQARSIVKEVAQKQVNQMIFIVKSCTSVAMTELMQMDVPVQVFKLDEVIINAPRHKLVPRHSRLSESEISILLARHEIQTIAELPKFSQHDPIVKYYNWPVGSVIRIDRTFGEEPRPYYRQVVKL